MGFRLTLDQDIVPVEPGTTAPLTLTVVGDSGAADRYELEVEGVDPEWKAIPVPIFSTEPGETHSEKVFFKPARASESGAGNYPVVVRVRSLETGESRTAQAVLQVKAFHHLSAELSPKKGYYSPARHQNEFDLSVMNLGNRPLTVQFSANDPEDICAYVFEHDQVEVSPGQQRDIVVRVSPRRNPILASGRLIGFTVSARATDANNVGAHAQAQLEQRAFLSPVSLVALFLMTALAGAWWLSRPQMPTISLMVDPGQVIQGQVVKVAWRAPEGTSVHIESDKGDVLYEGDTSQGSRDYRIDRTGTVVFTATASRDGMKADAAPASVVSTAPEVVPPPAIREFTADPARVRLGSSVTLRYKFSESVTEARLAPTGDTLDPALASFEVTPTKAGTTTYELVARNKDGKETTKEVKVEAYEESDAQILAFAADPMKVENAGATVTVSWQVNTRAVRVELKIGDGAPQSVESTGERVVPISTKTRIVLIAYDDTGRRVTRDLTVNVVPAPIPPPDGPTDGGDLPPSTLTTGGGSAPPDPIPPRSTGTGTTGLKAIHP
ncbi:hypothetical protein BH11ARM2_BH11ARM2_21770 [soil metagenome]